MRADEIRLHCLFSLVNPSLLNDGAAKFNDLVA